MLKRIGLAFLIVSSILLAVLPCISCTETAPTTEQTSTSATTTVETKVLRFSVPLPADDPMVQSHMKAVEEFNAAAGGKYKIEMYPGGVLGGMMEVFDLTVTGAIDICDFAPEYVSNKDPRFAAQSLPFVLKSQAAGQIYFEKIRDSLWQDVLRDEYNVELLSLSGSNMVEYLGTKPIYTMEDWKGKIIWVVSPTDAEIAKALGGSGMVLEWADGPSAMEKGVVDGALRPGFAAWMMKWPLNYATRANFNMAAVALTMNLAVFNSMPSDIQEILVKAFVAHEERMTEYWCGMEIYPFDELEKDGWEIYDLPADERAKWIDATKPIIDEYYTKLSPSDAEIIKAALAEANK
jgi:TRAP-type C4-dicarboxylate transport system substrate-binding protein